LASFQSRPDLQGVKTSIPPSYVMPARLPKQTRSSGGQNPEWSTVSNQSGLPKQTRSSGGQNLALSWRQPHKPSKADPIFRGSKPIDPGRGSSYRPSFQSRPDLQGVKTRHGLMPRRRRANFQSRPDLQGVKTEPIWKPTRAQRSFQSRPDLQGVKTPASRC